MSTIELRELLFGYGPTPTLRDISLSVEAGELLALIGPNGCGKTTLLKQLSGVLQPQQGSIYLNMKELSSYGTKELAQELAALEQHIQVGFGFRVREVVSLGRLPHLSRWQELGADDHQLIETLLGQLDLLPLAERSIEQLSSGERQRTWLGMALAQQPKILLLDEPTSHLDLRYQVELLMLLKKLTTDGLSVVMSIHELHLAGQFADRIALMHKGQIKATGPPEEILSGPHIEACFGTAVQVVHSKQDGSFLGVLPVPRPTTPKE